MKAVLLSAVVLLFATVAQATEYPTVREIENGLGYYPGVQLPKDIPARGRGWHVYYVKSRALGNGEYDVRVKLR